MEEDGIYKKRGFLSQPLSNSASAKGKMLVSSIVILLSAAVVFLGIISVLCFFIIKCGFIVNGAY